MFDVSTLPEVSLSIAPVVAAAGVTAIASLFGAKKGSNAAKDAAQIQNDFGQKALDEQKRVYDLERADEQRQRADRAGIFERYGTDPGQFRGNLPNPYGMDDAQTAQLRGGTMGAPGKPLPAGPGLQNGLRPQPVGPGYGGTEPFPVPGMGKPTVTLQAPTGEIMDVDLDQAPDLIRKGAVIVPKHGGMNAFGGPMTPAGQPNVRPYGMV